ncbi:MAG: hypothetical protein RIB45_07830 [Marivibrio sp.]|uniref:hypothetical protein n=1 Tax=Marivibrio sp. TaxID=2039719 RepID=UPI0032EB0180
MRDLVRPPAFGQHHPLSQTFGEKAVAVAFKPVKTIMNALDRALRPLARQRAQSSIGAATRPKFIAQVERREDSLTPASDAIPDRLKHPLGRRQASRPGAD